MSLLFEERSVRKDRATRHVSLQKQRSGRVNHWTFLLKNTNYIKIDKLIIKIIDIAVLLAIVIVITLIFSQRIHVPFLRP